MSALSVIQAAINIGEAVGISPMQITSLDWVDRDGNKWVYQLAEMPGKRWFIDLLSSRNHIITNENTNQYVKQQDKY